MTTKICECCGNEFNENEMMEYNGNYYCDDCFYENYDRCELCGDYELLDDLYWDSRNENYVCSYCLDHHYERCHDCNDYVHKDDAIYIDGEDYYVCPDCDENYYTCENCGVRYHQDNMNYCDNDYCYYCNECYENHNTILGYHCYNGSYKCVGDDGSRHYGIELETEGNRDTAEYVINDWLHCEEDGSLDNGYEIISQPLSLKTWKTWDGFKKLCNRLINDDVRSHDTSNCGLHIHAQRNEINNVDRIIAIVELFRDNMEKLGRRSSCHYARYFSDSEHNNDPDHIKKVIKDGHYKHEKYVAINRLHSNTIEFRFMRGTLNHNTLMATLELIDNIIEIGNSTQTIIIMKDLLKGRFLPGYAKKKNVDFNKKIDITEFMNLQNVKEVR